MYFCNSSHILDCSSWAHWWSMLAQLNDGIMAFRSCFLLLTWWLGVFMTVVSLETSLQGAMWSVAALRTQCLQVSIQQAMGLASGCLYVTWKTWGQGCLSHLALPGGQGRGHQVVSRNWHVRAGSRHCPHHARIGALPVVVRVCAWDLTCGAVRWFAARGACGRDS